MPELLIKPPTNEQLQPAVLLGQIDQAFKFYYLSQQQKRYLAAARSYLLRNDIEKSFDALWSCKLLIEKAKNITEIKLKKFGIEKIEDYITFYQCLEIAFQEALDNKQISNQNLQTLIKIAKSAEKNQAKRYEETGKANWVKSIRDKLNLLVTEPLDSKTDPYEEERQQLYRIRQDVIKWFIGELESTQYPGSKTLSLLGGVPASGKSISRDFFRFKNSVVIDVDFVREKMGAAIMSNPLLLKFLGLESNKYFPKDEDWVAAFQPLAVLFTKELFQQTLNSGKNIIYDSPLKKHKSDNLIFAAIKNGYNIVINHTIAPPSLSIIRAVQRDRGIPLFMVLQAIRDSYLTLSTFLTHNSIDQASTNVQVVQLVNTTERSFSCIVLPASSRADSIWFGEKEAIKNNKQLYEALIRLAQKLSAMLS